MLCLAKQTGIKMKPCFGCVQGPRRSSFGGSGSHPVLAVIASTPKRTHKVMYACIKGIPTLQESWLTACLAAHKLLPFYAFQQEVTQRDEGHQAFQGLAVHLAGAPAFQQTWGRLIRHAGEKPSVSLPLPSRPSPLAPPPLPPPPSFFRPSPSPPPLRARPTHAPCLPAFQHTSSHDMLVRNPLLPSHSLSPPAPFRGCPTPLLHPCLFVFVKERSLVLAFSGVHSRLTVHDR